MNWFILNKIQTVYKSSILLFLLSILAIFSSDLFASQVPYASAHDAIIASENSYTTNDVVVVFDRSDRQSTPYPASEEPKEKEEQEENQPEESKQDNNFDQNNSFLESINAYGSSFYEEFLQFEKNRLNRPRRSLVILYHSWKIFLS